MSLYLVERYTPSLAADQVASAVGRLSTAAPAGATHLWTVLIPGEDTCLSLFRAASTEAVAELNAQAGFAYTRIIPAVAFTAAQNTATSSAATPRRDQQ
jgi:hypothetical protein